MVLLLVTTTVVVLAGPSYFRHYSSFPAPFLAVVVGVAVAVVLARATATGRGAGTAAVLVVVAVAAVTPMARPLNDAFPGAQLGRLAVGKGLRRGRRPQRPDPHGRPEPRPLPRLPASRWTSPAVLRRGLGTAGPTASPLPRSRNGRWQRYAAQQLTSGSRTVLARQGRATGSTGHDATAPRPARRRHDRRLRPARPLSPGPALITSGRLDGEATSTVTPVPVPGAGISFRRVERLEPPPAEVLACPA